MTDINDETKKLLTLYVILQMNYDWKVECKTKEEGECIICLDEFKGKDIFILPCGDKFHDECCISMLMSCKLRDCPLCKKKFTTNFNHSTNK